MRAPFRTRLSQSRTRIPSPKASKARYAPSRSSGNRFVPLQDADMIPTTTLNQRPSVPFSHLILERRADAPHGPLAPPVVNLGRTLEDLGHGAGDF